MAWQDIAAEKQRLRAAKIAQFDTAAYAATADDVTDIDDAQTLVQRIVSGQTTSEAVVKAYIQKAIKAHQLTNCLTEVLFEDALCAAQALDAHLAKTGQPVGPLHGVPVTLKDQFDVAGYDSTMGYVGRANQPAEHSAAVVRMLQALGAVVLAKTNLPQSIMWCETDNNLWGLTTNPRSAAYTPGGSTGGEAALLACHDSLVGLGTDIGGSIRIPSQMMGIYGLKPSSARLPYRGVPVSTEGQEHVPSSVGPMARSLATLELVMRSLIDARPWDYDARCVPLPWRDHLYAETLSRPLTIGVLADDGVVTPHPPVARVLRETADALRAAGHEIIEWNAELHADCVQVMDEYYSVDGGEDIRRDVEASGEPFIPHVARLVERGPALSVYEYWQLNRRKQALQQAYLDKWNGLRSPVSGRPVDVLLLPPMPHAAVPHKGCRWVGYTKVWNVLDYPALVLPAGHITAADCTAPWDAAGRNPNDAWNRTLWTDHREEMARLNLPVGVQIVGRKLEEETVLAVGKVVEGLLRPST